jgi:hypothetical protein
MADCNLFFCDSDNDSSVDGGDWCACLQAGTSTIPICTVGIALPLIYVALGMGAGPLLSEWRGQRLEDQLRVASIAEFDDEPLSGDRGPIGVRLRYSAVGPRV